jgi:S1-C subfamily serine protease
VGTHLTAFSEELAALASRILPCVVAISGAGTDFTSSGSGFLIDGDGHAVTNQHVIDGLASPLDVALHGPIRTKATVVGIDPITDLAVVKIDGAPAHHLPLRTTAPRLGELCIAIGSPFGMYPESLSLGVVSGLARTIRRGDGLRPIDQAIQTDAAINPGNSGGPLVDVAGAVVGVNQSIDTRGQSIGFAVPADVVRWITDELIQSGSVQRATLGATVLRTTVRIDGSDRIGLKVLNLPEDAPATGLRVDDVIVQAGRTPVHEPGDLYRVLRKETIGVPLKIRVVRDGALTVLTVVPARWTG